MEGLKQHTDISGDLEMNNLDMINHPTHYTCRKHECIDEMIAIFGIADTIAFCKLNAWKYRYRAGVKGTYEEDMAKSDRYIEIMMELQEKAPGLLG